MPPDPYRTLGVSRTASDAEVRAAYRRLVQLHHPDHNNGSAESARRFEDVQEAYAQIRATRGGAGARPGTTGAQRPASARQPPPQRTTTRPADPALDARMAEIERQLREAQLARERARQAAREAAAQTAREAGAQTAARPRRASDEELGYIKTDDSFAKILADARSEIAQRYSDAREHPVTKRVTDLIDELAAKLTGEDPPAGRK